MNAAEFSWLGFDALSRKLKKLERPDAAPLMSLWVDIIIEDNRKGVLAGQDKDGNPMIPVTYRGMDKPKSARSRNKANLGTTTGEFKGFGPLKGGLHGNMTGGEYRKLTGPPLAPRGADSRVIANLRGQHSTQVGPSGQWVAEAAWDQVVSPTGYSFLPVHFNGKPLGKNGPKRRRDLRGVRPWGMRQARLALNTWIKGLLG